MQVSTRDRLEQALGRISDPNGEGTRACLTVYTETARAAADAADIRRRDGLSLGPLDGRIVSIKDLFDVAGEPTRVGSKLLANTEPAAADAPVVARLRRAGAIIVAKTNMTEFAFSGVGLNPHYGTPGNPADRSRIPGGSTSGGAVAVADGMCEIAIGTDTGGSTRIPAALCGIVGYKPSQSRIPRDGVFPLSFTLDSVGPMAGSVADCAVADAVMAGEDPEPIVPASLAGLRLHAPGGLPMENLDDVLAAVFRRALERLRKAGAAVEEAPLAILADMGRANGVGGFVAPEAYSIHRAWLAERGDAYDPIIRSRIERGGRMSAADYIQLSRERSGLIRAMDALLADVDVLCMPTCPIVAPRLAEVATPETFMGRNALLLRNTSIGNFFDLCAISLPLRGDGQGALPAGLMLMARRGQDRRLFRIAAAVERFLA